MSANKTEIENFDKYAYEWWNKRGPYKLLHNLTPIRSKYIQEQIDITNKKIFAILILLLTNFLLRKIIDMQK